MEFKTLKISKMTGKLADFQALNTNTLTNKFCQDMQKSDSICAKCYSWEMLNGLRKSCQPAWQHNSDLLSQPLEEYQIPTILAAVFRFSGHGELINETHLDNIVRIARKNPHCKGMALWTKRKDIVRKYFDKHDKPENLILIWSNPKIDKVITADKAPKYFDKVFNNVDKNNPDYEQNCTGQKCRDCLACYSLDSGTDTIIEAVK